MQKFITNLLLIFVFVTIGFALGKRAGQSENRQNTTGQKIENANYVQVLYFHGNQRCKTCKLIESMAENSVNHAFKDKLDKSVKWNVLNYQSEVKLAKKFDLSFSTVVVTKVENGEIVDFQRLDGVWEKLNDEISFNEYLEDAVNAYLEDA